VTDVLLPRTDAGVLTQVAAVTLIVAAGTWLTRRRPELRLVVIGLGLLAYGVMGVRSLH
jgi:hypothetical protein